MKYQHNVLPLCRHMGRLDVKNLNSLGMIHEYRNLVHGLLLIKWFLLPQALGSKI